MSYCRWSSNAWDCDVYVYADAAGGWTTHVASTRLVLDRAVLPPSVLPPERGTPQSDTAWQSWWKRLHALWDAVERAERVPIGLPCDGQSYSDNTPAECADRLEGLRDLGYHVPQYAIDDLREEAAENATG